MHYVSNSQEMIIILLIYSSLCIKKTFQIQEQNNLFRESIILNRQNQETFEFVFLEYANYAEILVYVQNGVSSQISNYYENNWCELTNQ